MNIGRFIKRVQMYLNIALTQKKIEKILIILGVVLFNDDHFFLIKILKKNKMHNGKETKKKTKDKEKGEKKIYRRTSTKLL